MRRESALPLYFPFPLLLSFPFVRPPRPHFFAAPDVLGNRGGREEERGGRLKHPHFLGRKEERE